MELEEQERNLKLNVGDQEKKAHECWVTARQAERKLVELQSETSVLKSRLTIAESKNDSLEKEKGELEGAIKSMKSVKSESGADSCSLASDSGLPNRLSLPPLPGFNSSISDGGMMQQHPGPGGMMLPGMMMPGMPGMMSMRPAPLGEISPSPRTGRRSRTSRSPSPEDRYRGGPYSPRSGRIQRQGERAAREQRGQGVLQEIQEGHRVPPQRQKLEILRQRGVQTSEGPFSPLLRTRDVNFITIQSLDLENEQQHSTQ